MINTNPVSKLATGGAYILLLFVSQEVTVTIGQLGKQNFPKGYYAYTGSALGAGASLRHRISRHLKKEKCLFWHIDYLLANENVSVKAVIAVETSENMECTVNTYLKSVNGSTIAVKGFGASDCKNSCGSHLLYFPEIDETKTLVQQLVGNLHLLSGIASVVVIE
jgi:Uri superfamily endonuclease